MSFCNGIQICRNTLEEIYALAIDYDKDVPETKLFFASVQNKLHWASIPCMNRICRVSDIGSLNL